MVRTYVRKGERQCWSPKDMREAILAVTAGMMGYKRAADVYSVPRSTLESRVRRQKSGLSIDVASSKELGSRNTFTIEEELELLQYFKQMNSIQFRHFVFEFAEKRNLKHKFDKVNRRAGNDWLVAFRRRHQLRCHSKDVSKPPSIEATGFEGDYEDESCFGLFLACMGKYNLFDSDNVEVEIKEECDVDQAESEEEILNKYIKDVPHINAKDSVDTVEDKGKPKLANGILDHREEYKKCNGTISPSADLEDDIHEEEVTENNTKEILLDKKEDTKEDSENSRDAQYSQTEKLTEDCNSTILKEKNKISEICEETDKNADITEEDGDKREEDEETAAENPEEKEEETAAEKPEEEAIKNSVTVTEVDSKDSTSKPAKIALSRSTSETKTDNENEDNDDLLCVMEEKSVEEANENKDENSCSASERDDETKENEDNNGEITEESNGETNEETNEDTNGDVKEDEDAEVNSESQIEMDMDASECAMDIEESDIGGVVYTDQNRDAKNDSLSVSDSKIEHDKDANKENENGVVKSTEATTKDTVPVATVLTNGAVDEEHKTDEEEMRGFDEEERTKETSKKSSKRQLSDTSNEGDTPKKIKLQAEEVEKPPEKEKHTIKLLESFKKFMLDKKLKKLTRYELEELCMQKMCECIINKSEIGELRQKIMIQEQTIDSWRKEAIVVAKQTRDLKIVHERLMADLKVMKEQTGKPLVPVKITRSVGLQAIIENPSRVRPVPTTPILNTTCVPQQRSPAINTNIQQQNKIIMTPQTRQQPQQAKPKVQPQRATPTNNSRPLQMIQKDNMNNAKPRQTLVSTPQPTKKNADPKAVIDLTDEDEKNQNAKQTTNTASPTVRVLNKQNISASPKSGNTTPNSQASKIMFVSPNVLQRNSAVMVKMNSNGLVNPQNGLTTIPNGQVSVVTTPAVRTAPSVRVPISSVTTVRTATPAKQIYKHPAPLPAAPNYQHSLLVGKKPIPPKPHLNLTRSSCGTGIVLQWKMPYKLDIYETIVSYQLYAYQETKSPPKTDNWGKIGDVKALELPMAVTLTQFAVGNRYFFAVRAVDFQKRLGPFSDPENILL